MSDTLRIIPLGGLGEVGKNMTVYEIGDEIVVVDAGLAFPRDEHLGVDLLLPDIGYLEGRRVRAVILTHGHEDHVGGLPYLLREVDVGSVIATPLTLALVKSKLDEHGLGAEGRAHRRIAGRRPARARPVSRRARPRGALDSRLGRARDRDGRRDGSCTRETGSSTTRRSTGSRPTSACSRRSGTAASTSCSATRRTPSGPGNTGSERLVGEAFRSIFPLRHGKILVASFASNIHRMQQAADVAVECGRKVVVVGRSMRKNLNIARNLGYVSFPEDAIVNPGRGRTASSRAPARSVHGKPGRADVGARRGSPTAITRPSRWSRATR